MFNSYPKEAKPKMMEGAPPILTLVGKTPIVRLSRMAGPREIYVKLEYLNPTGSHKDRIALYMIRDAEERGLIKPGDVVVEASSGNTAISVAWVSAVLGYRAKIFVGEKTSPMKVKLVEALGAEVVKAPEDSEKNYEELAREYAEENGFLYLNQSGNEANVRAHYETTGPELYIQLNGRIDAFVMGVGTGGTIAGVGKYLRKKLGDKVKLIAVFPRNSPALGKEGRADRIEGLAIEVVPDLWRRYGDLVDEVVEVGYDEAVKTARDLIRYEGILGGLSTGANVYAALKIAEGINGVVATLAPDSALRYPELLE